MADVPLVESESVSIESADGGTKMAVNTDGSINTSSILSIGGVNGIISVSTSAVEARVGGSRYANRKLLILQPQNTGIFFGFTSGVTTANGMPLQNGATLTFSIGDIPVYLIASTGTKSVFIGEAA